MAYLTLQDFQFPNWQAGGTTGYIRIFSSQGFFEATTGAYVPQGQVTNLNSAYQEYGITISGTTATIPEVTLASTTDSTVPNALYTAVLYTSANRPVYTLLSNFFVDPEYFQSPPQSAVDIADAGTAGSNGTYTYRGTHNNYPYYNLLGESDSTTLFAVVNNGSLWTNTDASGVVQYQSTAQADFPFDVTFEEVAGDAPAPTVSENANYISGTWEQLTLSNQASATAGAPFQYQGPFWDVQQTKQYVNSVVGDGTTPFASKVVVGKTALSANPALSTLPIAVGDNDARVNTKNVAQYSSFSAAVNAVAGLTGTNILEISTAVSSGTKSVPSDVILSFVNGGTLTCTSGTITVLGEIRAPAVLTFVESGGTIDISNAKAEAFYFEWKGITSGGDNSASLQWLIDQRLGSTSGYSTLIQLVDNTVYSHASELNFDDMFGMTIQGTGGTRRFMSGYFKYTGSGSGSGYTFARSVGNIFNNVTFSYSHASMTGFLFDCSHSSGLDTQDNVFYGCRFTGSTTAYQAKALFLADTAINNTLDNCTFAYGQLGYQGQKLVADSERYSVSNTVQNCTWNECGIHLYKVGEAFTYIKGSHQANTQSLGGSYRVGDLRIIDNEAAGANPLGISMQGIWCGDGATSASTYGVMVFRNASGVLVEGGAMTVPSGGAGTITVFELHGCAGVNIGNGLRVAGGDYYGAYDTTNSIGVIWSGDDQAVVNTTQSRNGAVGRRVAILGNYTKPNSVSNGLTVFGDGDSNFVQSNSAGSIDFGYKISAASTNASAEIAVMDSAVPGFDQASLSINAPYTGGDNPIYLSTYQGTTLTPRVRVSATEFRPETNDGQALGDTTHNWSDLFLASGAVININNGNWLATHTSGILTVTTGDLRVANPGSNSQSVVTLGGSQTMSAKTLTSPTLTTPTITNPTVTTGSFTSPALTTPVIGVATGTSLAVTGLLKSSGTAGVGYATGAGGTITQGTSRTTGVTINKTTGAITLFSASGSATPASFTVTNSTVAATDTIIVNQKSGADKYIISVTAVGAGSFEITSYTTGGTTSEQPVFNFCVLKGVAA